ncbi:MAG: aminoacyl-tRNA hydrolase, partial [Planctomycetota bacterium]
MIQAWKDWIRRRMGVGSLEMKKGASMKLIVGLGNPDSQYDQTRHNVGFMVADALAERFGARVRRKKFNALAEEIYAEDTKVVLLKPQQYMNRSGHAVATAAGFYKLTAADVLVVTDDMALDVGRLRIRGKGSAGGHNGLKDIIARLGSDDFSRLRVGIGDSGRMDAADYVLSRFSADEREVIDKAVQTAVDAICCWLRDGVDLAMTRYNAKNG